MEGKGIPIVSMDWYEHFHTRKAHMQPKRQLSNRLHVLAGEPELAIAIHCLQRPIVVYKQASAESLHASLIANCTNLTIGLLTAIMSKQL
jgi:hypothetical protein